MNIASQFAAVRPSVRLLVLLLFRTILQFVVVLARARISFLSSIALVYNKSAISRDIRIEDLRKRRNGGKRERERNHFQMVVIVIVIVVA